METPTTNKNKSLKENWKKAAAMAGAAMAGAGAVAAADVLREDEEAEDVKPKILLGTPTTRIHKAQRPTKRPTIIKVQTIIKPPSIRRHRPRQLPKT